MEVPQPGSARPLDAEEREAWWLLTSYSTVTLLRATPGCATGPARARMEEIPEQEQVPAHVPFPPGEDRLPRGDRVVLVGGKGLYLLVGGFQVTKGSECSQESGSRSGSSSKELLRPQAAHRGP